MAKGKGRKSNTSEGRRKSGKKGKKGAAEDEGAADEGRRRSSKGKKGKGKGKGRKSKGARESVRESVLVPPPPPPAPEPEPEPEKPEKKQPMGDADGPCRYTEDACCVDAVLCRPNRYPGMLDEPQSMAVVGSECGTYSSICKLLRAGLRCADRVFIMTPWGNYVIFRCHNDEQRIYFLFDGCTCNVNRFRYLDLQQGTAGLLYFEDTHPLICYIMDSKLMREKIRSVRKSVIDDICREYCEYGGRHSTGPYSIPRGDC